MISLCVLHTVEEVTDLKRQAVEEMMDRIKRGVHLRPVNQTARPKVKVHVTVHTISVCVCVYRAGAMNGWVFCLHV